MSLYNIASRLNTVEIGLKSKVSRNNPTFKGAVTGITKAMVGLNNVDNTSDNNKPVSQLTSEALNDKQNKLSSTTDVTARDLTVNLIKCTGTSGKPSSSSRGVYIGMDSSIAGGIEICTDVLQYIDFTIPGVDCRGRIMYAHNTVLVTGEFRSQISGSNSVKMSLSNSGLSVDGTLVTTSDKRLKFNEKPLVNALDIINRLEPVEYDQTYNLTDTYTEDTPHSHQCGFIAQSVQQIDELRHAVVGGVIGEDGKETLRAMNYNAIFTYAVKAIQELSQLVKAQQLQINELQAQLQNHLLMNSATIIS